MRDPHPPSAPALHPARVPRSVPSPAPRCAVTRSAVTRAEDRTRTATRTGCGQAVGAGVVAQRVTVHRWGVQRRTSEPLTVRSGHPARSRYARCRQGFPQYFRRRPGLPGCSTGSPQTTHPRVTIAPGRVTVAPGSVTIGGVCVTIGRGSVTIGGAVSRLVASRYCASRIRRRSSILPIVAPFRLLRALQ